MTSGTDRVALWWSMDCTGPLSPGGVLAVRTYLASPESARVELTEATRRAAAARRPLLWVARVHTAGTAVALVALADAVKAGDPAAQLVAATTIGVSAAYWAIWGWSALAPLPAAVVGLTLYLSLSALAFSTLTARTMIDTAELAGHAAALAWVAGTLALLVRAVVAATRVRRAIDHRVPTHGVLPALALYAALLAVLCGTRALLCGDGPSAEQLIAMMRVMAFVVIAAAIVKWRAVWPALANGGGAWLAVGVVGGLGTFAVASLYGDAIAALFHLPQGRSTDPMVAAGYGWAGAVLATAIYPAVVEELAFRGLIVQRLGRVLGGGEAVFVSAAMFAVLHLRPTSIPPLLLAGVGLGVLRRRSGSLWPCILMHLTHNAAVLAAERWV